MDYAMWSASSSNERSQQNTLSTLNQIPYKGAKTSHSEMRSGIQQGSVNSQNMNDSHYQDMQKMDSNVRYNDGSSHNSSGNFHPNGNNNLYRNMANAVHSSNNNNGSQISSGANSEANGPLTNQGSFGAQFNSASGRSAKNQGSGSGESNYVGNGNNSSPYSGWPGLNSTSISSSSNAAGNSGGNGWIIPNNISSMKIHDNSNGTNPKESLSKECDENMSVDNEMSYTDLVGATGGSENGEKQSGMNCRSMSWGMPSRLGLLGGGENSMNQVSNAWNSNQGIPTSSSSTWEGGRGGDSGGNNSDMMVDNQSSYSGVIGAVGGSEYQEPKQNEGFKQDGHNMQQPPPRLGLLGGGESSLNAASPGWGNPGAANSVPGSNWGGANTRMNGGPGDMNSTSNSGMSPPKPHGSWAQAAGKGLNPNQAPPNNGSNGNGNNRNGGVTETNTNGSDGSSSGSGKSKDEVAAEIKVKAAVSEGWGQKPVNQDTPWDVPLSPPASEMFMKEQSAAPPPPPQQSWRAPVNNGTEIWQNNLRMNKTPTMPPPQSATPWGHTPATNIGGHWGEDDDDASNNTWNASHGQVGRPRGAALSKSSLS